MKNLEKKIISDTPPVSPELISDEAAQIARVRARLANALSEETNSPVLASALKRLRLASGLSSAQMAFGLGTTLEGLDRLALCRIPRDDRFIADAEAIANYCDCDLAPLITLLRSVQTLFIFAQPVAVSAPAATAARSGHLGWQTSGALIAARDADENPESTAEANEPKENRDND